MRAEVLGKPILYLGVGRGRTIPLLQTLTNDYRAIDFMQSMVDISRKRYPPALLWATRVTSRIFRRTTSPVAAESLEHGVSARLCSRALPKNECSSMLEIRGELGS